MIPKIIHYCWFGRNTLPSSAQKCIASWKKYFPNYEIKEWNEDNFDVNIIPYTREAYSVKKYAFVSDYARFWVLYYYGGLYFDTDVEVIKSMDDIVERGAFMGIEGPVRLEETSVLAVATGFVWGCNPGLGLGCHRRLALYQSILDYYATLHFLDEKGKMIPGTVVKHTTEVLIKYGLRVTNEIQKVADVWIYPQDYFNPLDDATGRLNITENTRSIHWYSKTWVSNYGPLRIKFTRLIHRYLGVNSLAWLKKLVRK
ncbi:glycosyltransferase family 32 protein [Bacteroides finegoldii]|jgi:hypothetical protein|uniref:glycosyltransferase family 32 protein n=1 Tax=Bacteroides finegoldii TaxID=338188 RepID=UPI0035622B0A